jgi:hypothetical protein
MPMHAVARAFPRAAWLVWFGLLFGPHTVFASGLTVVADFDGDGRHDRAELQRESSLLRVWLSKSHSTSVVRSSSALLTIAASDLDGDGRHELIASGALGKLHVWTKRRHGFVPLHPKRETPRASTGQPSRTVTDRSRDTSGAELQTGRTTPSLTLTRWYSPPPFVLACTPTTHAVARCSRPDLLARLGSRPPPLIQQL